MEALHSYREFDSTSGFLRLLPAVRSKSLEFSVDGVRIDSPQDLDLVVRRRAVGRSAAGIILIALGYGFSIISSLVSGGFWSSSPVAGG